MTQHEQPRESENGMQTSVRDEGPEPRWNQLKDALRTRLRQHAYASWVSRMTCLQDDGDTLTIGLPDMFSLDWVNNHYRHVIEEELAKLGDTILELKIYESDQEDHVTTG